MDSNLTNPPFRIGVVLAGAMSKGAYEIGCMKAIDEFFGRENISYISGTSIGGSVAYSYATDRLDVLTEKWKNLDYETYGRMFPSFVSNPKLYEEYDALIKKDDILSCNTIISILNISKRTLEYVNFRDLDPEYRKDYLFAAMSLPPFAKGITIKKQLYVDGAYIDNIPVYPLTDKDLDFIFCVYFDTHSFIFEDEAFDRKVIKLNAFPYTGRVKESLIFDCTKVDSQIEFGYEYALKTIKSIFTTSDKDEIIQLIAKEQSEKNLEHRYTGDILFSNINKFTAKMAERKQI